MRSNAGWHGGILRQTSGEARSRLLAEGESGSREGEPGRAERRCRSRARKEAVAASDFGEARRYTPKVGAAAVAWWQEGSADETGARVDGEGGISDATCSIRGDAVGAVDGEQAVNGGRKVPQVEGQAGVIAGISEIEKNRFWPEVERALSRHILGEAIGIRRWTRASVPNEIVVDRADGIGAGDQQIAAEVAAASTWQVGVEHD